MRFQELAWAAFLFRYIVGEEDKAYLRTRERLGTDPASAIANLGTAGVQELILSGFINRWRCRVVNSPESARALQQAVSRISPLLSSLAGATIQGIDFAESIHKRDTTVTTIEAIDETFRSLSSIGFHFGDTAASKLLHLLQPNLFVMWDGPIWCAFESIVRQTGRRFTYGSFLQEMQRMARDVCEDWRQMGIGGEPSVFLSRCLGYSPPKTFAKYLDECNWVTITRGAGLPPEWHPGLLNKPKAG